MKKMFLLPLLALMVACSDDKDNSTTPVVADSPIKNLKINEIVAKGSDFENEYGNTDDWVEIYNPTNEEITLTAGNVYFSDNISDPTKWGLSADVKIAPNGYLIVCCDDSNCVKTQIHTNFKLTADGEEFSIYYTDGTNGQTVDQIAFPAQDGTKSYGRLPDGGETWDLLTPTPLMTNQQ